MTIQHVTVTAAAFFKSHPGLFLAASKNPHFRKDVIFHQRRRDLIVKTHDTEFRVLGGRPAVRKELESIATPLTAVIEEVAGKMSPFDRMYDALILGEWICRLGVPEIREREAGPLVVTRASGTYFGSGSFSAAWYRSEGCEESSVTSKDNGFARYVETEFLLTAGDWVLDYYWADPGSKRNILWICR